MTELSGSQLTLHLFGQPRLAREGQPVRLARRKAMALLAYLALSPIGVGREAAGALLWPDYDAEQASAYLRQALWELNRALGKGAIVDEEGVLRLAPERELWVDVARFEEALGRWRALRRADDAQGLAGLEEAAALYRHDFMAGFGLRDSPAFDEWQAQQAEALRRQLGEALMALAAGYTAQGDLDMAIASLQRWLVADPLDEAAHRELMRLYAWAGQRVAALRQYESCAARLREELRATPEPATRELHEQIRNGALRPMVRPATAPVAAEPSSAAEPPVAAAAPPPVMPSPTPFVGRNAELARLAELYADPACRLVTLLGPGGIGKTCLARQFAASQAPHYAHGVAWIALAGCSTAEELIAAIAEGVRFGLRPAPGPLSALEQEWAQLGEFLRARELLLALDDMEGLVAAAPLLSELIAQAPRVRWLVTSRERLGLPEEWALELQGLSCSPGRARAGASLDGPDAPGGATSAAAELFLQCAQRVRADRAWQASDCRAIARICELVEGSPLAIELAAAWVGALSPEEIASELERDLDLLVSRQREAPERHASLRAAFDGSWRLLSEAEQSALAQLAVFRGGFTRGAAAQVAHASIGILAALLDKSLLRRVARPATSGSGRYGIHQVLRQYAAEELAREPAARQAVLARHGSYYLDLLEAAGQRLMGPAVDEGLEQLRAEAGNVQAAVQTAMERDDWRRLSQVLAFWILALEMSGSRAEALAALGQIAASARQARRERPQDEALRGVLATALAGLLHFGGQMGVAPGAEPAAESLALTRGLPDSLEKAYALLLHRGPLVPWDLSQQAVREALAILEVHGHRWGQAMARTILADGLAFISTAYAEAEPLYRAAIATFDLLGHRWGQAVCLVGLAQCAWGLGRPDEAITLAGQSLALYREMGDAGRIADARTHLARFAEASGDHAGAEAYLRENLEMALEQGQRGVAARFLTRMGQVARLSGHISAARTYYEQALALYRELGEAQGLATVSGLLEEL